MFLRYISNITIFTMKFSITFWTLTVFYGAIEVFYPIRWAWLTHLMEAATIPVSTQNVVITLSFLTTAIPALLSRTVLMKKCILRQQKATAPTPEEKERLDKAMATIQEKAGLKQRPFIYIGHADDTINAYAISNDEIIVTKNMYDTFNDKQLTGILAHEVGHIQNQDVKNTTMNWSIDLTSSIILTIIYWFKCLIDLICGIPIIGWPFYLLSWLLSAVIFTGNWILDLPSIIISRYDSREKEKKADLFACEIGLSEEVYEGIKEITKNGTAAKNEEKLYTTHPEREARLKNIENYIEKHKAMQTANVQ